MARLDVMLFAHKGGPMRRARAIGTAFLFVAGTVFPSTATSQDNSPVARIDHVFSSAIQPGDPGAAVIVKVNGQVVFKKGYGVRELRTHVKIDPETNFRLASVTKQFTAMAILLLIHDGKLHYEDHLTNIFPDFPAYGKEITIRNLLTHTSGLPDYGEIMQQQEKDGGQKWSPEHQIQDEEVLALLKAQPAGKFAPGTQWEYSNSGYVVLGLIVAKVSGVPYREFLQRRIFKPLRMSHTVVYQKGMNTVSRRAYGHTKESDKFVEADQSPTSATLGDGGIYSNVVDMGKWDEGLRNHTLLSEKEMEPAVTPVRLADGSLPRWPRNPRSTDTTEPPPVLYGFGWMLDPYKGHARIAHDGGTMGFRTTIQRFVNDHLTIVVLCNRTDINPEDLALKVADLELEQLAEIASNGNQKK
jgi:CubicO group peptidase (beta-lactamase class C family)